MADPTPKSQAIKTYHGNCHCGAFQFKVKLPKLDKVTECNCSICFKKGFKWLFPTEGGFLVEKGEGSLAEYEFGQKSTVHKFCPICGTPVLQERKDVLPDMRYAVNARTLMIVDLWALEVVPYNGAGRDPQYVPALYTSAEPSADVADPKIYNGSCHCGAVTLSMKTKGPLLDGGEDIQECDCSICARNGTILIYPHPNQVHIVPSSAPALTSYRFGPNTQNHKFCSICGTFIYIERVPLSAEEFAKWHTSKHENWLAKQAVNLRLFEGVEWKEIEIRRAYWSSSDPQYVCPA